MRHRHLHPRTARCTPCTQSKRQCGQGVTLIELLVGLGILAFLLLMTVPSARTAIVDARIRTAAQAYYDGAQMARSEALRRNGNVTIELTDGGGWQVKVGSDTIASKPAGSGSALTVEAEKKNSVTFDSLGQAIDTNTVKFMVTGENACAQHRCLNVDVSQGGQVRLCDPASDAPEGSKC